MVKEAMPNFLHIVDLIIFVFDGDGSKIMNLSSWGGVEGTSIKDDNVISFLFLLNILQDGD